MMDRTQVQQSRPDAVEMLQLDYKSQRKSDKGLDQEEIGDLLKETFAKKEEAEPTVGEILAQEDAQEEKEKKAAEEPKPVEVTAEDTMSFTEQLELAKKQEQADIEKAKKKEEDKKKADAAKAKKLAEKKKKQEEEKIRKAK